MVKTTDEIDVAVAKRAISSIVERNENAISSLGKIISTAQQAIDGVCNPVTKPSQHTSFEKILDSVKKMDAKFYDEDELPDYWEPSTDFESSWSSSTGECW